jgi:hypothetical protein
VWEKGFGVMITLFSAPKPFRSHTKVIQENALQSWVRLFPPCEIILFGDQEGVAEAAVHFGVRHVPEVSRNEYGTPLLDDLFLKAQKVATNGVMCYINADIILMSDFLKAVEVVCKRKNPFLLVGRRWNINVGGPLDFSRPDWDDRLCTYVCQSCNQAPADWIDYFVFPRGFYVELLPFSIGRAVFDNWLLWKARSLRAPIIDASKEVMAVHQNHDYSHHPQGKNGVWYGTEAQHNRKLMGGGHHFFTVDDAGYRLTCAGLKLNLTGKRLARKIKRMLHWLLNVSLHVRRLAGLCNLNVRRVGKLQKEHSSYCDRRGQEEGESPDLISKRN